MGFPSLFLGTLSVAASRLRKLSTTATDPLRARTPLQGGGKEQEVQLRDFLGGGESWSW